MATEPKEQKWRIGGLMSSGLFAKMPSWEREMKRLFGDLCNGHETSSTGTRERAAKPSKEQDENK